MNEFLHEMPSFNTNTSLLTHLSSVRRSAPPSRLQENQKNFTDDWAFLNMDDISQLNLRVLKRHNPYITSLIDKSSYCVIYTFSEASAAWTKAGYEGTLFIYTQQPHVIQTKCGEVQDGGEYGFCVLNRLNLENFWGEINGGDIVLEEQYIITRSLTGGKSTYCEWLTKDVEVFGLWLFEEGDRRLIYNILDQYVYGIEFADVDSTRDHGCPRQKSLLS